jgi:hypothetical protein
MVTRVHSFGSGEKESAKYPRQKFSSGRRERRNLAMRTTSAERHYFTECYQEGILIPLKSRTLQSTDRGRHQLLAHWSGGALGTISIRWKEAWGPCECDSVD